VDVDVDVDVDVNANVNVDVNVDVVQFAKKSSQKALITFAGCGLALSACTTNLLSPLSTPSNDLGENISDIIGDREHLSFWLGII
jgi:hypothetical protein